MIRAELVFRRAILDVLCSQPGDEIGGHLRQALIDAREPGEDAEDRCEARPSAIGPWHMQTRDWTRATGRAWGGPILCESCARRRLAKQPHTKIGRRSP